MKFTESMLMNYSQPLSATEDGQCKNAIRMVADALKTLGFTDDNAAITPLYTDTFAYSLQMRRSSDSRKYQAVRIKAPMQTIQMSALRVMWTLP